jgi:hypothetical protein
VPFTLIASARSLAPASPIWLRSRLHPDRITVENGRRAPFHSQLIWRWTTHGNTSRARTPPFAKEPKLDSGIIFLAECGLL